MNNKNKQEGKSLAHVCFKSHLVDVSSKSWRNDISTSIHITNLLHGWILEKQRPKAGRN